MVIRGRLIYYLRKYSPARRNRVQIRLKKTCSFRVNFNAESCFPKGLLITTTDAP